MTECTDFEWWGHVLLGGFALITLALFAAVVAEMWCYIVEVRYDIKRIKRRSKTCQHCGR